jgi:hypothetical protein
MKAIAKILPHRPAARRGGQPPKSEAEMLSLVAQGGPQEELR